MFAGAYTAIVTPFNADGGVDYDTLRALIDKQIEAGIDGIVPVGTTGESPTLTMEEHNEVIRTACEAAGGRIKVIAGTGANCTREAVELTRHAIDCGADGTLQVTPYYNKPSQEGLFRHFSQVADLGLPTVLYNIPGRTGREIALDTVARLAEHPAIVAVKEAGGSVDRVSEILQQCDITVLSGDDPLTLPMMSVGASGVISVASNLVPEAVARMVRAALDGDWTAAGEIHRRFFPLFKAVLSLDTNPVPVKAAMAALGLVREVYRPPLCPMSDSARGLLADCMKAVGLQDPS